MFRKLKQIFFYLILWIINRVLKGTHFFGVKRFLFNSIGIKIGKGTKVVGPVFVNYVNKVNIGNDCWIGKKLSIDGNGGLSIGDRCDLAPHVVINTGSHHIGGIYRRAGEGITHHSKIGNGSWIGTKVTIVNGANIGESVVVAAGSVVIKDIDKNILAAGVPAKAKKILG